MRATKVSNPSVLLVVLQVGSFLWLLIVGLMALVLLAVASTGRGQLFAIAALVAALLPATALKAFRVRAKPWSITLGSAAGVWLAMVASVAVLTPSGQAKGKARLTHGFVRPGHHFSRYSLGNLLPESDQLRFAFTVMPLADALFTSAQASRLKDLAAPIYEELEADADFYEAGSVMSHTYRDFFGFSEDSSHTYVYVPQYVDSRSPVPLMVFFHGSGGNFKAYLWILSKVADQCGFALVAPSGGFGNWTEERSAQALSNALDGAARKVQVDARQIHLIGLSNGGLAVSRLAEAQGANFASLTFVSPVFATASLGTAGFAAQTARSRILVVTGSGDDRVPLAYVEDGVARISRNGSRVTLETIAGADHFLFFEHRHAVQEKLAAWLRAQ